MIYDSDKNIVKDIEDYSVILHQVNTKGTLQQGIGNVINKTFSGWYDDYHSYCGWFDKDRSWDHKDHSVEIIGSFHRYQIDGKNIIICSAFGQRGSGKEFAEIDLDAWDKILTKIINQTRRINKSSAYKWTIHIPENIGRINKITDNYELLELFKDKFGESDVDLYIHTAK